MPHPTKGQRIKRGRFVLAFREFLHAPKLSLQAKALLLIIKTFANARSGLCFPSIDKIAKAAGCSRASVGRHIEELRLAKFLHPCQLTTIKGKKMSSQYVIDDDRIPQKIPKAKPKQCPAGESRSVSPVSYGEGPEITDITEANKLREDAPTRRSLIAKAKAAPPTA